LLNFASTHNTMSITGIQTLIYPTSTEFSKQEFIELIIDFFSLLRG